MGGGPNLTPYIIYGGGCIPLPLYLYLYTSESPGKSQSPSGPKANYCKDMCVRAGQTSPHMAEA